MLVWPVPMSPIASRMNVTASSRNTSDTAAVVLSEAKNMYVVKIAHIHKYADSACGVMSDAGVNRTKKKNEIQNAPNDVNATALNVLPVRNSHIPASSCARPP